MRKHVNDRKGYFVAAEGIPFLLAIALVAAGTWRFAGEAWAILPLSVFVYLYLIFRDPRRLVPPAPFGVVSPVDGKVAEVTTTDEAVPEGKAHRILIRVSSFGTYTARSPVEGKVGDLSAAAPPGSPADDKAGLWLITDEGRNVVLRFLGNRFGLAPRAFLNYGERLGQGQRCAYLRLTKLAELELPIDAKIAVSVGERVAAGSDLLATLH
jgi:phosphatidylserine decarboxylase